MGPSPLTSDAELGDVTVNTLLVKFGGSMKESMKETLLSFTTTCLWDGGCLHESINQSKRCIATDHTQRCENPASPGKPGTTELGGSLTQAARPAFVSSVCAPPFRFY